MKKPLTTLIKPLTTLIKGSLRVVKGLHLVLLWLLLKIPGYRKLPLYLQKTIAITLSLTILLSSISSIFLYSPFFRRTAEAVWFNDSWGYRQAVTVTVTSSASDVTNSQTIISVNTSTLGSKLQSACQDLRFTNTNGKVLPYYLASSCNNSSTTGVTIWVLADLVPKNTTTYTMYMYYGNPGAAAASDSSKFSLYTGLVGYWPMDEASWNGTSGEVVDSSGSGNHGTALTPSGPTTAAGKFGNGGSFDGINDYVNTSISNLPLTNLTISFWANETSGNTGRIFGYEDHTIGTHGLAMYLSGSTTPALIMRNNGAVYDMNGGTITTGTWHHYVVTISSTSGTVLYLDGTSVNSSPGATAYTYAPSTTFHMGSSGIGGSPFKGQLDETRIYNRVLSATDVSQLYNTSQPTTSFATEEKAPSPIAYWKFDDSQGQTAQDSTTSNNDGTLGTTSGSESSDPTWQTEDMCVSGKCLKFDGTDDYLEVADSNSLDGHSAITFGAWIRPAVNNVQMRIIDKWTNTGTGSYALLMTNTGKLMFGVNTGSETVVTGSTTISANVWHYVMVVYDGSTVKAYIDGKQDSTTGSTTGSLQNGTSPLRIGYYNSGEANYFKGFIDEVKIYPYARSAAQILADYNSRSNNEGVSFSQGDALGTQGVPLKNLSNGLVGYWKMDEGSSNSCSGGVNDSCDASGNDGAWNGDATSIAGKFGNGTSFDGTGDYVTSAQNVGIIGSSPRTITVWFKQTNQVNRNIVGYGTSTANADLFDLLLFNGTFIGHFSGANNDTISGAPSYSTGVWNHGALTYDGTTIRVYLNGVYTNSKTITLNTTNSTFTIGGGGHSGYNYFNGQIDEVRVYNRALSPNEVSALYNFAPPPKVYLKMDEGTGTSANDSSGNSNNGTVNTGTWTTGKYGKGVNVSGTTGSDVSVPDFGY